MYIVVFEYHEILSQAINIIILHHQGKIPESVDDTRVAIVTGVELQIRRVNWDNSKIICLIFSVKRTSDPLLNCLARTVLMSGHNLSFYGEIWIFILKLSLSPLFIWGTGTYHLQHKWCF